MNESGMESLAEVFKCYICLGKLKDAHLCPSCSKPCCYACILQWLASAQRSQCPHCRVSLQLGNLVNCRWVEDVTQHIDTLQQIKENAKKELCKIHDEKLSVFCLNCKQCICHKCALWDKTHFNHVFKPLEEVCLQHVERVDEELIRLRERQSEITSIIKGIEKSITDLTNAKNERVGEIRNFMAQTISQLEQQLEKKLSTLFIQKILRSKECDEIKVIVESSKELKTCCKSEVLLTSKKIMQRISELKCKPITNFENLYATKDEFPNEIIPPYDCSTFVISNFNSLQLKAYPIYSQPLQVCGSTWRLKVYPAGHGNELEKYLAVLFQLSSGISESAKYQYKVEMIHQNSGNPLQAVVQEFTSDFDVGECWGFNHFYPLNKLENEGYLNAQDTLILKFSVRPASYYQKSKIQEWYISQLRVNKLTETSTMDSP